MGFILYAMLTALASLNRESGAILVAIYAAYHWKQNNSENIRKNGTKIFILLAVYVGITAGLHIVLGQSDHVLGLLGTLQMNISNAPDAVLANLILSPLYWLIWRGYRDATPRLKRLALVGGVYVVAIAVGGSLGEMQRLILPCLPLLLPLVLTTPNPHSYTPRAQ